MNLASCEKSQSKREVVLYTSCDDYLLRDIIPEFEKRSGIKVLIVGDTEATKTTGLVQRLLDEKDHPRADVWWSNEPFGSVRLSRERVLEPYASGAEKDFSGQWPKEFRAADGTWYGFAYRARAIVYNTKKVAVPGAPAAAADLADPRWKGRIGMARPQFGTTRGQLGALYLTLGAQKFRTWAQGLKANGVRLYDGNSTVVRAAAQGEIDVGLTDTDDVYARQHEGWPVALRTESNPLLLPNTVGRIRGCPHPAEGGLLIDYLLSKEVDRALAASEARLTPVRAAVASELHSPQYGGMQPGPDYAAIEAATAGALAVWDEVFGR